jgi:hypothetical protein
VRQKLHHQQHHHQQQYSTHLDASPQALLMQDSQQVAQAEQRLQRPLAIASDE